MFSKFEKFLAISAIMVTGAMWSFSVLAENWEAPTANPPLENRFRPINTSDLTQVKSGTLYLANSTAGLIMDGAAPLIFGYHPNSGNKYVGFKAPKLGVCPDNTTKCSSNSDCGGGTCNFSGTGVVWSLPITDGQNGWVLRTDGSGNLSWINPSAIFNVDADWRYDPTVSGFTSIYSERLTRVGAGGTRNYATSDGDLYVQNKLEVDGGLNLGFPAGSVVFNNSNGLATDVNNFFWDNANKRLGLGTNAPNKDLHIKRSGGNAEIDLQSGANTHWGLYQVETAPNAGDLRFWNTNDRVTFTNNGLVGIGTITPAQALEVAGGIKLSGLLFGNGGAGISGQILSRNASNIEWINPTWWTNFSPDYIYSTQNTRIGNTGTVDQANGAGDLYVQNKLEVDGNAYLKNISATSLDLGFPNGVIPFQGASGFTYDANKLIWNNTSKRLGLGTTSTADFTLQVAGDVGPNINNTYDLGSTAKRWANIFANNLNITGGLDLGFTAGSVIFQGPSVLAQNNSKFFWDNTNNRLGIGTSTPAQALDVKGNINLTNATDNLSEGALFYNGNYFLHNSGVSYYPTPNPAGDIVYSNVSLGNHAGSLPAESDPWFNMAFENTAMGYYALSSNLGGTYNTAIGSNALFYNTGDLVWGGTGSANSAVGAYALYNNTTGQYNSAVGYQALKTNSLGNNLVAVGYNAGYSNTASSNVFVGFEAGKSNSSGNKNVYFGNRAGYLNTIGIENVYIGNLVASANTNGSSNIIIGSSAGASNTSGSSNVMLGARAGNNNVSGSRNIFLGTEAGLSEIGSNRLYIEPSNADSNKALIYGQFYSTSTTTSPLLRFNGKVGVAPRGTTGFTPNRLLHIYSPQNSTNNADNAEIDIQSVAGANKHWAIYNDRNTESLVFWNNNIVSPEEKNLLTLATVGLNKDIPAVGIGTGLDAPFSHLEVRNKAGVNDHGLTLSSYTQSALGSTSGGSYGSNVVVFRSGRYKVEPSGGNTYQAYNGAIIYGGFKDMGDGMSQSDYRNAKLGIQTLTDAGGLSDTIVAQNIRVGIAGNIMRDKTLTVHGSTWSEDYWSDNLRSNGSAGGEKGNSGYVCVAVPCTGPTPCAIRMRFEDGLYICSCANGADCTTQQCYCDNY